jgi:hypothetical protein
MANTLTSTLAQILTRGMMGLREEVLLTRLVNTDYSTEAKKKGQTIDIPIASDMGTADSVTPAATPTAPTDITTATAQITLSNWYHKAFALDDREIGRINADKDFVPLQMNEAFRVLAKAINDSVFATYKGIYGYVGTAGTTPFGAGVEVGSATSLRQVLNEQLCPRENRKALLDFGAETAALNLAQFSDAEKRGSSETKTKGNIGRVFGLDWYGEDGVPTHTAGTVTGSPVAGDAALGATSVGVSGGFGNYLEGDIITFAGDTQTYAVGETCDSSSGILSITPGLKVAITGGSAPAIALKDSHVVNLGFHRDAFGLAMRAPDAGLKELLGVQQAGNVAGSITLGDPVTNLVFRLELIRGYKMTIWDLDCLWGTALISPARAARLAG